MNSTSNSKKRLIPFLALLILAVITAILILAPFFQGTAPNTDDKTADSVVTLNLYDANGVLSETCSGYAAFDKDILITNYHFLKGSVSSIEAQRQDGSTFLIDSIVIYDEKADIAILRAPNCGLTPLNRNTENDLVKSAQALYDSRIPEQEISIADWCKQHERTHTVDSVLANGSKLHNQTITIDGYISGMDTDIYLVSSPELVASLDARSNFDLTTATKLRELASNGHTLHVDATRNHISLDSFKLGDSITVKGTIMYYSASDMRLVADSITKSK